MESGRRKPPLLRVDDAVGTPIEPVDETEFRMGEAIMFSTTLVRSPKSMMLSPDENFIMRMPDFGTFMHHQEHLQQLLVDIHQDPGGFETYVTDRRTQLEEAPAAIGSSVDTDCGTLADYRDLREVGKGRFSTVFFCRRRADGQPCAIKCITLDMPQARATGAAAGTAAGAPAGAGATAGAAVNSGSGGGGSAGVAGSGGAAAAGGDGPSGGRGGNGAGAAAGGGGARGGGGSGDAATYDKCLKEVGLLKNLKSPHIVGLHGCFLERGSLWIVLEWVDGGDLRGILAKMRAGKQRFHELTLWSYAKQICEALCHMHGQRIMHRDLKPANILVRTDGTVKLGDLGLGRYLHVKSVMAYSQVGTPLYMSPEVLMGRGHTFASDIWSLGCVLFEMAMLHSAFYEAGLTMEKLFRKVVDGAFATIDTRIYSRALGNLIDHLLVVDPAERPHIERVAAAARVAYDTHEKGLPLDGLSEEDAAAAAVALHPDRRQAGGGHVGSGHGGSRGGCGGSGHCGGDGYRGGGYQGDGGGGGGDDGNCGCGGIAAEGAAQQQQSQQQQLQQQPQSSSRNQKNSMAPPPPRPPRWHSTAAGSASAKPAAGAGSPLHATDRSVGGSGREDDLYPEVMMGVGRDASAGGGMGSSGRLVTSPAAAAGPKRSGNGGGGGEHPRPETLKHLGHDSTHAFGGGNGNGGGLGDGRGGGNGVGKGTMSGASVLRPETPQTERGSMSDPMSPEQRFSPAAASGTKRGLSNSRGEAGNGSVDNLSSSFGRLRLRLGSLVGVGRRKAKEPKIFAESPVTMRAPHGGHLGHSGTA